MNTCKHTDTRVSGEEHQDEIVCQNCGKQWNEDQWTNMIRDFSFTYARRGHPTQVISTRATNLNEAVENMFYHMERFGFTKEQLRKELLNG